MTNTYTHPTNTTEAIAQCDKVIRKLATKFTRNHYALRQDFEQAAAMGVCEAFQNHWDPAKPNRFSTYAYSWAFVRCKELAVETWGVMNCPTFDAQMHGDHYTFDDNSIDFERAVDKLDTVQQEVYHLKMEGHTYDQISTILPAVRNLQHARKIFKKVEAKVSA